MHMGGNIDHSIDNCNSPIYLTGNSAGYSLLCMSFSERVKAARTFANLTQEQLAEKAGMRQPSVWYLENCKGDGQRSKYTAGIASACGVNASWLADGIGEMLPDYYHITDQRMAEALRIMENLPDYAVNEALKSLAGIASLVNHNKQNGTSG